ncbi:hypothetical protein B0H67DRAFT_602680 [Lasiosphaeris hirsuta]|uniref:Zn(2)-C6 fungal-type domain-containing protein n=1 Tax=Lasiosphaeris hirsuta TaxID=260670 RepID=A0AA40A103_9PEZI|nr:hypothetical protein B0H67DRAFT_602680 [Lasiosphaeris hirsuta]
MRQTLRRSCAACARAKHSCDLRTPRCSRCIKRRVPCVYANEPLTAVPEIMALRLGSLDPFDSYPQTRLRRDHVQRLIHSFLNKIAFQYYPLDLSAVSNPFLISWWPLALGDPALFHVSLQTACLDEELLAQKGFGTSELLMADSVALLRRRVEDATLAVQDATMNSVITLATIEFGKGNVEISKMHVDGVKRLVDMRGGINAVRQTSPLTARMVSWVSMLIMCRPQFSTQDDVGIGDGIPPIPEWQLDGDPPGLYDTDSIDIDDRVKSVLTRLRRVFGRAQHTPLTSTRLHDLTCFVVHRLLSAETPSPLTECVRHALILTMLTAQGPTYYSHGVMLDMILARFKENMGRLGPTRGTVGVWLVATGAVASAGTAHHRWFMERERAGSWDDAFARIRSLLWAETLLSRDVFRAHWEAVG